MRLQNHKKKPDITQLPPSQQMPLLSGVTFTLTYFVILSPDLAFSPCLCRSVFAAFYE